MSEVGVLVVRAVGAELWDNLDRLLVYWSDA